MFFWDFYEAKISAVLIGIPIYTDISDAITFLPLEAYKQFETLGFAEVIKEYICHISAETLLKLEL